MDLPDSRKFFPELHLHSSTSDMEDSCKCRPIARRRKTSPKSTAKSKASMLRKLEKLKCLSMADKENLDVHHHHAQTRTDPNSSSHLSGATGRNQSREAKCLRKSSQFYFDRLGTFENFQTLFPDDAVEDPVSNSALEDVYADPTSVWSLDQQDLVKSRSPSGIYSPQKRFRAEGSSTPFGNNSTLTENLFEIKETNADRSLADLSFISQSSTTGLREQISGSSLNGAFCSTFSYPLHSTLIELCNSPFETAEHLDSEPQQSSKLDAGSHDDDTLVKHRKSFDKSSSSRCHWNSSQNKHLSQSPFHSRGGEAQDEEDHKDDRVTCSCPNHDKQPGIPSASAGNSTACHQIIRRRENSKRSNDPEVSGLVENSTTSSCTSASGNLRKNPLHKLKRQIGQTLLNSLMQDWTIDRSKSSRAEDETVQGNLSLIAWRSSVPDLTDLAQSPTSSSQDHRIRPTHEVTSEHCLRKPCPKIFPAVKLETLHSNSQLIVSAKRKCSDVRPSKCNLCKVKPTVHRCHRDSDAESCRRHCHQRKKALLKQLRNFRRVLNGHADPSEQFKTFFQL